MADQRWKFDWQLQDRWWIRTNKLSGVCRYVFEQIEYNAFPILELSVKFASQICHENSKKTVDGSYLSDFGIDIKLMEDSRIQVVQDALWKNLEAWT